MNCKQGDLAIVVKSYGGHEGAIVRCVRISEYKSFYRPDGKIVNFDAWELDRKFMGWDGGMTNICPDEYLRPIRPSEGADETLTWKAVPRTPEVTV